MWCALRGYHARQTFGRGVADFVYSDFPKLLEASFHLVCCVRIRAFACAFAFACVYTDEGKYAHELERVLRVGANRHVSLPPCK